MSKLARVVIQLVHLTSKSACLATCLKTK
jgi:hypothetical protein